jgi:hypothetical protein
MLASADLEGEVRELLAEAKNWYRKKGGALPLQVSGLLPMIWSEGRLQPFHIQLSYVRVAGVNLVFPSHSCGCNIVELIG